VKHLPKVSYLSGQGAFFFFFLFFLSLFLSVCAREPDPTCFQKRLCGCCCQTMPAIIFLQPYIQTGGRTRGKEERKALLFGSVKSSVETCLFRVVLSCRTDKKKNNIMISFCLLCLPSEHSPLLLAPIRDETALEDKTLPHLSGDEYIHYTPFFFRLSNVRQKTCPYNSPPHHHQLLPKRASVSTLN